MTTSPGGRPGAGVGGIAALGVSLLAPAPRLCVHGGGHGDLLAPCGLPMAYLPPGRTQARSCGVGGSQCLALRRQEETERGTERGTGRAGKAQRRTSAPTEDSPEESAHRGPGHTHRTESAGHSSPGPLMPLSLTTHVPLTLRGGGERRTRRTQEETRKGGAEPSQGPPCRGGWGADGSGDGRCCGISFTLWPSLMGPGRAGCVSVCGGVLGRGCWGRWGGSG